MMCEDYEPMEAKQSSLHRKLQSLHPILSLLKRVVLTWISCMKAVPLWCHSVEPTRIRHKESDNEPLTEDPVACAPQQT